MPDALRGSTQDWRKEAGLASVGGLVAAFCQQEAMAPYRFGIHCGLSSTTIVRVLREPEAHLRPTTIDALARGMGVERNILEALNGGADAWIEAIRAANRFGGFYYKQRCFAFRDGTGRRSQRTLLKGLPYPPAPLDDATWQHLVRMNPGLPLARAGPEKAEAARIAFINQHGPELPNCRCGCGRSVAWPENKFLYGHNLKGCPPRGPALKGQVLSGQVRERLIGVVASEESSPAAKMIARWILIKGLTINESLREFGMHKLSFRAHQRNRYWMLHRRFVKSFAKMAGREQGDVDAEANPLPVQVHIRIRNERNIATTNGHRASMTKAEVTAFIAEVVGVERIQEMKGSIGGRELLADVRAAANAANPPQAGRHRGPSNPERDAQFYDAHTSGGGTMSYAQIGLRDDINPEAVRQAVRRHRVRLAS